ncbi:MAG: hypothetical protein K8H88_05195, partial [Sandaracinaceae bacterium]|nr:hypothetical protein [Sandaracinaceae bacterium]
MSAEQKPNPSAPKPPPKRAGTSLTDAVVAALAKVDDKKEEPPKSTEPPQSAEPAPVAEPARAEAGCAETAAHPSATAPKVAAAAVPPMVQPAATPTNGSSAFRTGAGSFSDL